MQIKSCLVSPVNLSCLHFIMSPAARTQEGKEVNLPLLNNDHDRYALGNSICCLDPTFPIKFK